MLVKQRLVTYIQQLHNYSINAATYYFEANRSGAESHALSKGSTWRDGQVKRR